MAASSNPGIVGALCPHCEAGCKCGRMVMHDGTCLFCGHGMTRFHNATDITARWSRASVLFAMRRWARDTGFPPAPAQWKSETTHHPSRHQVLALFPTWKDAVRAAGFKAPAPTSRQLVAA